MERPVVVIELATDAGHARDLAAGGVFVPGCLLAITSECVLVVRGSGSELRLDARVVFVDGARGAGLELIGFNTAMKDRLATLVGTELPPPPLTASQRIAKLAEEEAEPCVAAPPPRLDDRLELAIEECPLDPTESEAAPEVSDDGDETKHPDPERRKLALNMYERLRGLTLAEQIKKAHSGDPNERMVLERMYGKTVWEPLLRNPRLTAPEVSRIARMGTLPRTMIEVIVGNGAWLQIPEVRRALLSNPRMGTDQIVRVLRLMPKHELKLASLQTAYPFAVRECAKRLMKDGP